MSLVISVQTSLPCAHTWLDGSSSSWSASTTRASSVSCIDAANSRIVSRIVAAIIPSVWVRTCLAAPRCRRVWYSALRIPAHQKSLSFRLLGAEQEDSGLWRPGTGVAEAVQDSDGAEAGGEQSGQKVPFWC